jgi:type I restriction enzyme S subunit
MSEWFDNCPESWKVCRLDEVAEVIDSLHKTPNYSTIGYPMVRVADIRDGFLDLSNSFFVTGPIYEEFTRRRKPEKGDIVFSRVGTYGNASYVATDENFCLGQNTALIHPRQILNRFLHYWLLSPVAKYQIESSVVGSTQKTISLKSIGALQIPVPLPSEQKAIASILSSLDDKIELNRRMNETLEAMARAIFKDWFVDFGPTRAKQEGRTAYLPEHLWSLFPEAIDPETGLPMGWEEKSLGELFCISIGRTPPRKETQHFVASGEGKPWLSIKTMGAG